MERADNEDLLRISFHWENLDETHFTMCQAVALIPGLSRIYSFLGFDTQQTESGTGTFALIYSWDFETVHLLQLNCQGPRVGVSSGGALGNLGHILKSKNT